MGLLRRSREAVDGPEPSGAILLEDERLMHRIDACHVGDFERENHPDRCAGCGNIEPGFHYCRRCGHRIKRKGNDAGFCYQEVAGSAGHQDVLGRIVSGAEREEDGGVYEWVTAVLLPGASPENGAMAVQVGVKRESTAEIVGYIPPNDAAAIHTAVIQVQKTHERSVACMALIQGGVHRRDGSSSSYGIRLLLPLPSDIPRAAKAALEGK